MFMDKQSLIIGLRFIYCVEMLNVFGSEVTEMKELLEKIKKNVFLNAKGDVFKLFSIVKDGI